MTTPYNENLSASPDPTDVIDVALIAQLESSPPSDSELYTALQHTTPAIAYWLRRRAVELNPDLKNRGADSRLALELAQILLTRTTSYAEIVGHEIRTIEALYADSDPEAPAA
ncbi:MAG: hypothetical protein ABIV43_00705 [Candidatus Saccharimonadales bacterium]